MERGFLRRYLAGEQRAVWQELASGEGVGEAASVAAELARRAYHAMSVLYERLRGLGYAFALRAPTAADRAALDELRALHGPLPPVVDAWYSHVGCVDFSQASEQLYAPGGPLSGLGLGMPLVVLGLPESTGLHARLREEGDRDPPPWDGPGYDRFVPIGSFASSCEPMGLQLPSRRFDPWIGNDGGGPFSFGDQVRLWLRGGGFPSWLDPRARDRYPWVPDVEVLRDLTRDLQPL